MTEFSGAPEEQQFSMRGMFEAGVEVNSPQSSLAKAAESHGVELDDKRLSQLAGVVQRIDLYAKEVGEPGLFEGQISNGIHYDEETHGLDFLPKTQAEPLGAFSPQPQDATSVMLQGIRGVQDLVLMIEAGYLQRPDELAGSTNAAMAKLAQRIGFELGERYQSSEGEQVKVRADFDAIRSRVFSEEMRRTEAMLERRLQGMDV